MYTVCCCVLSLSFIACSNSDENAIEAKPVEIMLSAGFDSAIGEETRGEGSIYSNTVISGNPLSLSIVRIDQASETDASYLPYAEDANDGQTPLAGKLYGLNRDVRMRFDVDEYYLSRTQNNKTKLIAWYPSIHSGESEWEVDNSSGEAVVTFTIDGETDILMSNLVEGDRDNPYDGTDNRLVFRHLLTRIKVRVYTTDADVGDIWGGLRSITIADKAQNCKVQLPDVASDSDTYPTTIVFGADKQALAIIPKNPADNSGIEEYDEGVLPVPVVDEYVEGAEVGLAGYAMIAPEDDALYLTIETENVTSSSLKINAPEGGAFQAGHSYTIAIGLITAHEILITATVQEWDKAGEENVEF